MKLNDYAKGNRLKLPLIREAIQDPRGVPLHECRYLDEHLPCSFVRMGNVVLKLAKYAHANVRRPPLRRPMESLLTRDGRATLRLSAEP